tara:strand:+ start:72 stop:293 length:222 start_codon:yes stop_codon:yes gene_type:complete
MTLPGHALGAKVLSTKRNPNGDITYALQHWKKLIKDSGILDIVKEKKEYQKKSVTRRRQLQKARYISSIQDND